MIEFNYKEYPQKYPREAELHILMPTASVISNHDVGEADYLCSHIIDLSGLEEHGLLMAKIGLPCRSKAVEPLMGSWIAFRRGPSVAPHQKNPVTLNLCSPYFEMVISPFVLGLERTMRIRWGT